MTWIKLDDKCPRHPKLSGLSHHAFRVWIQALCFSSEFLTDGVLPAPFLRDVPAKVRAELVAAGLWFVRDGQMVIHDYLTHQTSRAAIEAERSRNRRRRTGHVPPVQPRSAAGTTGDVPRPEVEVETERTTKSTAPAALVSQKSSTWKRSIAIAHAVMDECPDSQDWTPEFKARCAAQGINYGQPGGDTMRPLFARALDYVEGVRKRRTH